MSHRVTVQTEIKDRAHLLTALKEQNIRYEERGENINLLSGDFTGAHVNLKTGNIVSGDVDHYKVDAGKLGLLRQAYALAKYKAEAFQQGVSIENQEVLANGEIKLRCKLG